jgi:hypothetical protein
MLAKIVWGVSVLLVLVGLSGCGSTPSTKGGQVQQPGKPPEDTALAEREKLSPEDRALVDAQEWCVVDTENRLGVMGPPVKIKVKGQTVFLCCAGCKTSAQKDEDKTLATLKELQAKAGKSPKPK